MNEISPPTRPKILMVTRLFPSTSLPSFGTFCAERAKALSRHADVRVIVPTPWCPPGLPGPWAKWSRVERTRVTAEGIPVSYPRFATVPKTGTWIQGVTMARSVGKEYYRRHSDWVPDLVDGHFAFPDGYAAVKLARRLSVPSAITCHGSDLLKYPSIPIVGKMLRWALRSADRVISVSTFLQDRSIELGCPENKTIFLTNGVDADKFTVRNKQECRRQLGLSHSGRVAVCVGYLIDRKNHIVPIRALAEIRRRGAPPPLLVLVGDGPNRGMLETEAQRLNVSDSVYFAGERPHAEIATWMGASDWTVLASLYEGWATVYFESMACGRPVLTSNCPSANDCICDERYGTVVEPNTPEGFADAFEQATARDFDADQIRAYAEHHSWDAWAGRFLEIAAEIPRCIGHKQVLRP